MEIITIYVKYPTVNLHVLDLQLLNYPGGSLAFHSTHAVIFSEATVSGVTYSWDYPQEGR